MRHDQHRWQDGYLRWVDEKIGREEGGQVGWVEWRRRGVSEREERKSPCGVAWRGANWGLRLLGRKMASSLN